MTEIGGTRFARFGFDILGRIESSLRLVGETIAGAGGSGKTDNENSLPLAGELGALLASEVDDVGSGVANWAAFSSCAV